MSITDLAKIKMPEGHADLDPSTYFDQGFLEPLPFLSNGRRKLLFNHLTLGKAKKPVMWHKARAANDRLIYDIASDPMLIGALRQLIGDNIILWGAGTIKREPGEAHNWHVDIESSAPDQRFASVWIGLSNTSRESGLMFVTRSHSFGKTIQEVQRDKHHRRGEATDETVLSWAKEIDPAAELSQPDINDGEALIFDGRAWHGSLNRRDTGTRLALLLQYASTDVPVFMPDPSRLEWPFKFVTSERPPVIVVSGKGNGGGNAQVSAPPTSPIAARELTTEIRPLGLPLLGPDKRGWRSQPLFKGLTKVHHLLGCHASELVPGKMPHLPHAHIEEEILIVLEGEAEILIGDNPEVERAQPHRLSSGMFVYYPAFQHHTLRNASAAPVTYLMFKWRGALIGGKEPMTTRIVEPSNDGPKNQKSWQIWRLMEGPTDFLGKLHAHQSEVMPGGGYEPHSDEYDVAIVVLSGAIETLGRKVGPFGVVFYAAGEPHGLRCISTEPARYLVFEFHGEKSDGGKREKLKGNTAGPKKALAKRIERLLMAPIRHFKKKR